ncbi:MAG: hypothetical protein HN621_05600 [Porticoccaceae bacterium]|nr:hypothetical protein [Porticoccaceae bacterium]
MSKFTLDQLTEGIRQRHVGAQYRRLTEKWNRTGLLRGLEGQNRETMAVLLENQAAQALREANTLGNSTGGASGDVRGFQNVAFPIVRRVFGGLVANDIVSIQPMSLPSGLLFYLDYTYGTTVGGVASTDGTYSAGQSIYNSPSGKGVRSGSLGTGGNYDLAGSGYSRKHTNTSGANLNLGVTDGGMGSFNNDGLWVSGSYVPAGTALTGTVGRLLQFDPALESNITSGDDTAQFVIIPTGDLTGSNGEAADLTMIKDIALVMQDGTLVSTVTAPSTLNMQGGTDVANLRRLNQRVNFDASATPSVTVDPVGGSHVLMVVMRDGGIVSANSGVDEWSVSFVRGDTLNVGDSGDALTIPSFESSSLDGGAAASTVAIPEIDIKIESIAVTAQTRKLKAKWSPELAQDLNAYHSLDAEVELTQILSEQIALELDREILNDLLTQANGANLYWSRAPGKFVHKETGAVQTRISSLHPGPAFTGTVREWYETLTETIIDAANQIHRKTLRGSANFVVVGPDVATILESSVLYKPVYSLDGEGQASGMSIGAEKVGNLSNRFTVYKDPYFPRNKILLGYKGGSYLETGYVYAPYVPLIVTPTIFAPEDFTPRKGVMTRYGKKMVRSDFYGTVTCMDMNII